MIKQCPSNREFFEEQYIKLGKSIRKIEREFGYSDTTIWLRLKEFGLNRSISESVSKEKNSQWKGDEVGYCALHEWIRNHKPKPKLCEKCKKNKSYDLANISGEYKRDINDFRWLCRSCHNKEHNKFKNFHKKNNPKIEYTCLYCNKKFLEYKSTRPFAKYCSWKCYKLKKTKNKLKLDNCYND